MRYSHNALQTQRHFTNWEVNFSKGNFMNPIASTLAKTFLGANNPVSSVLDAPAKLAQAVLSPVAHVASALGGINY
jgi:hypothetical protein